jgi:hypothetical protein
MNDFNVPGLDVVNVILIGGIMCCIIYAMIERRRR